MFNVKPIFWCAGLLFAFTVAAEAHTPGLSTAHLLLGKQQLEAVFIFATTGSDRCAERQSGAKSLNEIGAPARGISAPKSKF